MELIWGVRLPGRQVQVFLHGEAKARRYAAAQGGTLVVKVGARPLESQQWVPVED